MAKILYLVRHGATAENLQGRFIGKSDVPLSADGVEECKDLRAAMDQLQPEHVLLSPLLRCRQTVGHLFDGREIHPVVEPALAEIDFGAWEGLTFGAIAEKNPVLTRAWSRLDDDFCFPDGEALKDFNLRMRRLVEMITALEGEVILAVTHGGVIRHLLCQLLGLSKNSYLYFHVATASMTAMEIHEGRGVLLQLNWRPAPLVRT